MVKMSSYFAMTAGAFVFWHSMDKVHVWIALHQDEKREREEKEMQIRKMRDELLKEAKQRDSLAVGGYLSYFFYNIYRQHEPNI